MSRAAPRTASEPQSVIGQPSMSAGAPPIAGLPRKGKPLPGATLAADGVTSLEVLDPNPVPSEYDPGDLKLADGHMNPPASHYIPTNGFAPGPRVSPPVRKWVVMEDNEQTSLGKLRRGKVLDELNFNIDRIATAGVRIEEIPAGHTAADVLLGRVKPQQSATA